MSFWESGIYLVIVAAVGCIVVVAVMLMTRGMGGKKRTTKKKSTITAVSDTLVGNDVEQLEAGEPTIERKQLPGPEKPAVMEKSSDASAKERAKTGTTKKPDATDAFSAAVKEIENGNKEERPKAPDAFLKAVEEIERGGKEEENKPKILDALSAVVQEIENNDKGEVEEGSVEADAVDIAAEPYDEMSIFQAQDEEENPLAELAQNLGDVELDDLCKLSRELREKILGRK
jgi:hypothetical protein